MNKVKLYIILFLLCTVAYSQISTTAAEPIEYTYKIIDSDSLKAFVFYPSDSAKKSNKAITVFHGGGWVMGEPSWGFWYAQRCAEKGLVGISVQYRLSDQKTITPIDAMQDTRDFFIWVRENAEELGIEKDSIAAYGWSAGAHLISSAAVFPTYGSDGGISSIPSALILQSPALSVKNDGWFQKLLIQKGSPIDYSPGDHIRVNLPPSIIVIGRDDTVTPLKYSEFFRDEMIKHGNICELHIYDGVGHLFTPSDQPDTGWPNPDKEVSEKAFLAIDQFLKEQGYIK